MVLCTDMPGHGVRRTHLAEGLQEENTFCILGTYGTFPHVRVPASLALGLSR